MVLGARDAHGAPATPRRIDPPRPRFAPDEFPHILISRPFSILITRPNWSFVQFERMSIFLVYSESPRALPGDGVSLRGRPVLLLAITTYSAVKRHRPGRLAWALATLCMAGTFVLLPLDFVEANLAMLDPGSRHRPCPPS